jgi:D-arabinose 5-phosphate isomerase GutQ
LVYLPTEIEILVISMKEDSENTIERAREIIAYEAQAISALSAQFDRSLEEVVGIMLQCRGHILTLGAGTSRAVAQRFAHLLSCSGIPALALNGADALHGGSGAITARDVLFVISKGGHSAEINQIAAIARQLGAKIIAQTENLDSPLALMSDAVFRVRTIGDVDPYGMIATGSSLVNSAVGDVLCVLLLERGGYAREAFGATHPGGAVGKKLTQDKE